MSRHLLTRTNLYTDNMFLLRSPRPWPPAAVLFALLIAATFISGETARAQTPTSVQPATPAPASSIPSVAAPTPANSQSTPAQPQTQYSAPQTTQQTTEPQSTQPQTAQPAAPPATTPPDQLEQPIQVQNQQKPPAPAPVAIPPAVPVASVPSMPAYGPVPGETTGDALGSTYIPVDSIVYPLAMRLYSMGYLDTAFIAMRPWTRRSLLHILQASADDITSDGDPEATAILAKLQDYLAEETPGNNLTRGAVYGLQSVYTRVMGIGGPVLRDSFHLGQSVYNDYGRPYSTGFNNVTGFSSVNEYGRFSLYIRGEFQHAPAYQGYSAAVANQLSCIDEIGCANNVGPFPSATSNNPQSTIPYGSTNNAVNTFRLQEANLAVHWWGHEISFGKSDSWLGPGMGGAMAWSNNAENMYSFRINRVDPLYIPLLSKVLGPLRYDFMVGSLKGHSAPEDPWAHSEVFSFKPTKNFDFSFQRTVIWGGKGHGCFAPDGTVYPCTEPITIHTFLKSFFSLSDTTAGEKYSRDDPGARFSVFTFSYRLPFLRKYVTLYTDSIAHDDVTPISAPRRAAYRPGVYISHFPGMEKLDFRIEAASTDTSTLRSLGGQFNYWEVVQRQGYTNKGFIMGDWIGREAKGGNAWLTYHLSGDEWVQLQYMNKKGPKDFIPDGTTQNQFTVDVVKNLRRDIQLNAWMQYEHWKAPIYKTGPQSDVVVAGEIKFYPKLHTELQTTAK
ncbi:MAG TPA: capsule assembly Wzi family protein [Acidobacteriaceae bacterium]|nr:capsule assembly Wzi family protein [Acidobacteriaceae bacterium]